MKKLLIVLLGLILVLGLSACGEKDEKTDAKTEDTSKSEEKTSNDKKEEEKVTKTTKEMTAEEKAVIYKKNVEVLLNGKVKVPSTEFKTQEQVEAELGAAGLKVKFVVANFDSTAAFGKHFLRKGECKSVFGDYQPAIRYCASDEVGDKQGYYADEGETIIVGYSDHDFDGTKGEK